MIGQKVVLTTQKESGSITEFGRSVLNVSVVLVVEVVVMILLKKS